MSERLAIDDLMGQAREGWRLGATLCTDCDGYHQMRGVLRATRIVRGPDTDDHLLDDLMGNLVRPGHRILIAGAGDPGQLANLVRLAPARPLSITIIDRCPAPLALIERLASMPGISIKTSVGDLTTLDETAAHDLILSHSMLPFLAPADRITMLKRFHQALAPGGKLLITVPITRVKSTDERLAYDAARLRKVLDRIAASPDLVALMGEDHEAIITRYEARRASRTAAFTDMGEVLSLIEKASFTLDHQIEGGESTISAELGFGRLNQIFLATPV